MDRSPVQVLPAEGTVPIVDLAPVIAGVIQSQPGANDPGAAAGWEAAVDAAATAIDRACREVGFFAVVGHGVADESRSAVIDAATRFFALPEQEKQSVAIADSPNNRGFAGIAGEHLQADLPPDLKETFDIGMERPADDPTNAPLEGPNQWPDLEHFREPLTTYQAEALSVAKVILRLMARALDLPESFFDERLVRPQVNLRLIRYPWVADAAGDAGGYPMQSADELGCGAHSDYGCLTLLFSDGTPGLQLQRLDGTWLDITVPPGALIVNLGDMLQRWTNDQYRSTLHRVIRPTNSDRYSVPVFVNPNYGVDVTCLPSCCSADRPARHEPVLAGEYLQSRFNETFVYRRSEDGGEIEKNGRER